MRPNESTDGLNLESLLGLKTTIVVLGLSCLLLVLATGYRVYTNYSVPSNTFDWENRGHSDFHTGAYYPAIAFRNGINPYSPEVMESYPVSSSFRPCPPITFITHLPFTIFELHPADVAFYVYNVGLLCLLSYLSVMFARREFHSGWWLLLTMLLLISRPGHITLFTGYYTLELVIGTLVAIQYARNRPWLSGLGMLVASAKPTFVIPLIFLMFARKDYRALIVGVGFCTLAGLGGLGWLALDEGFGKVVDGIVAGQEAFHTEETEYPINTWTRVDLLGMFAKVINWIPDDKVYLAGMLVLLVPPCLAIRQIVDREEDRGANSLTGVIVLLSMLLTIYHHSYDCLLVVPIWFAVSFCSERVLHEIGGRTKWGLRFLLFIPLFNYASTQSFRDKLQLEQHGVLWQSITLMNGACLFAAMCILLMAAWRRSVYCTIQKDFGR